MLAFVPLLLASSALAAPALNFTLPRACGTVISDDELMAAEADFVQRRPAAALAAAALAPAVANIPVYWHVIASSTSLSGGYVPDSQIADSIDVINAAYVDIGEPHTPQKITYSFTHRLQALHSRS